MRLPSFLPSFPFSFLQIAPLEPPRSLARCTLARDFGSDLMLLAKPNAAEPGQVSLSVEHLQQCLQRLAVNSATRERERYTAFNQLYCAVVGRLHEKLTQKSIGVQELKLDLHQSHVQRLHEVHCGMADQSQELIFEVTALRAAVVRLREELQMQVRRERKKARLRQRDTSSALIACVEREC